MMASEKSADGKTTKYTMPDGRVVVVDNAEVYECMAGHRTVHYRPPDRCPECGIDGKYIVLHRTHKGKPHQPPPPA